MKKISKALSVLCSMTTFACMFGTNPAIAMVRDDEAAAAGESNPEADGNNRSVAELRKIFEEKEAAAKAEAEAAEARAAAAKAKAAKAKEEATKAKEAAAKAKEAEKAAAEKAAERAARAAEAAEAEASEAITRSRQAAARAAEISKSRQAAADRAAAAERRKDEERKILKELEEDRQRAEEAGRRREESSKELGKLEMELAGVRQRLGKVKQALMTLKLSETPDASKVREAIEEEKNQKKEVEEAELRVREATKKFEALKMEERRAVERNIITEIEAFDLGIISCPPVDDYRLWRVRELIGWNMKKFDENLKTAGQISRLDHDFGLGAIFGAIVPDLYENLSNLKKLEKDISELLSKESNFDNMKLLRSISYKVRSLIEYYDYRGRNVGEKAIELIYGKDENLQYMVEVKHRNRLSHPEVWTAGFLSFLKSHGVEKLNLDIDYGKRYGEAMFNELMNNPLDIHNPVFCALVAFAKCIKQNNESLSGVIDVYIKLAEVASAVSSIYGRSPYKEVVNRFYRTMNPDGTPNEDSVKEIEELEKCIRCGTIWR